MVTAHGEPFTLTVPLELRSPWRPAQGQVQIGRQRSVSALLQGDRYKFALPPQIASAPLRVHIGDARQRIQVEPTLRPELTSIEADVVLPEYLARKEPLKKDVRGGSISLVKGSVARFAATASRKLASAKIDGQPQTPDGARISSPAVVVDGAKNIEFQWKDEYGLAGKEPFTLSIVGQVDEAPSLSCEDLPRQKVILDSEQIGFRVKAQDDFGVKHVGMEWQGIDDASVERPARGERLLAAGGSDQMALDVSGTFSAELLDIEPQAIQVRVFVEDYFPGRARTFSPMHILYVLSAEQHAVWMTEQLSKWHRHALEVRDREMQLYETNKQLRDLAPEELDRADTRRRIENQAAAERAGGHRLSQLTVSGEELIRQASRNPEFGVGHLEKWAEMLQILKDISANRMPSVADLLKDAAQAKNMTAGQPDHDGPKAGEVRGSGAGSTANRSPDEAEKPPGVPQVVDVESTQQPADAKSGDTAANGSPPSPRLGLPTTTLVGGGPSGSACPAGQKLADAVKKQQDLLAEFEKIADELNTILANLEGSTLVKRLKAASREQYRIAGKIGDQLNVAFGLSPTRIDGAPKQVFGELTELESKSSHNVSLIMDDMQAYFERRRFVQFKTVLEDMKEQDVVGGLRQLGDDVAKEHGLSIAQCEYWSDAMDRWAEDLVDPASGGT
jgi:hypothetical protein